MKNLKVGTRLGLSFGIVLVMLSLIAMIGVSRLSGVNEITNRITTRDWTKAVLANDVAALANDNARASYELLLLTDKAAIARTLERIDGNKTKIAGKLEQLEGLVYLAEGREKLAAIREARKPYVESFTRVARLLDEGRRDEAARVMTDETMPALAIYLRAIDDMILLQGKILDKSGDEAEASYQTGRTLMVALGVIATLFGIAIAGLISRGLLRQLGGEPEYAAAVANQIATGDLTVAIETKASDRSSLLYAMKQMNESLADIVTKVRGSTESITTASQEIAQGNADLSQRTEEQASSLEETASSMEELTTTVRQNTENARLANQLATSASDIAARGGQAVGDAVHTMNSLSESSKKIAEITYMIDSIAFQTNILALNAAVEAARAGEQGRGFAVVAGEVRNLAQRSAAAAREIKTLIEDSVGKVEAGSRQVNQAGATMGEVVQAVKRVTDIMAEIAAASKEQGAGIEQVNQAVTQIDEVTQQNAALVEEAAAAAETMQEQALALAEAVRVFKVKGGEGAPGAAIEAAPRAVIRPALVYKYA